MIYHTRTEVENIGKAGAYYKEMDDYYIARSLSSYWLALDKADLGFTPHFTYKRENFWEAWITCWMSKQVFPGAHCMDIGANHGYYAFMMQQAGAQCMAVEPQSHLCELMSISAKLNKHQRNYVEIVQAAISDYPGEIVTLDVPDGHGMNASISSYYHPIAPNGNHGEQVETATVDSLVSAFTAMDFIKIDVEGAEEEVWAGMQRMWRRHRPVTLLEFRWDRYENPVEFADRLFKEASVSYVDTDAKEKPVQGLSHLATQKNADWMLVLR